VLEKFTRDDDLIILEDELQRVQLVGDNLNTQALVTGGWKAAATDLSTCL